MSSPHSALLIGLGLGKKPDGLPPSTRPQSSGSSPRSSSSSTPQPGQQQPGLGGKVSRDEAGFCEDEQICGGCKNYTRETGDCSKVEGQMGAGDGCGKYFEPAMVGGGPEDLMGSMPSASDPLAAMGSK